MRMEKYLLRGHPMAVLQSTTSLNAVLRFGQSAPPLALGGSLHARRRCIVPIALQVRLQGPKLDHWDHLPSTGHPAWLQSCHITLSPTQSAPPPSGAGLLHSLDLLCLPPPQVAEHEPYEPQLPQPPFSVQTAYKKIISNNLHH